ncbi:MAG: menaquinol-cytochrome c reductase cytochrome b/c subunit [Solirubrobacteraceae bacterium]|nr:menaquinol-cytochrome c reductase cytochrome b/c subunit [Solirubrobacteraceae bacterium]
MGLMQRPAAILAIALLAGCGADQGSGVTAGVSTGPAPRPFAAAAASRQFGAGAERVCAAIAPPLTRLSGGPGGPGTGGLAVETAAVAARVVRLGVGFRRLALPRGAGRGPAAALVGAIGALAPAGAGLREAGRSYAATNLTDRVAVGRATERLAGAGTELEHRVGTAGNLAHQDGLTRCEVLLTPQGAANASPLPDLLLQLPPSAGPAGARSGDLLRGRKVLARNGCLACHRISGIGSVGPGPDLTRVGARLPAVAIAAILRSPLAPMPSYRNLPPKDLALLVGFLAALRR